MKNMILVGFGLIILCAAPLNAEESIPASVKAKMNGSVGTWEFSEEVKESPSSDPVTVTGEWTVRWIFENLIEWRGTFISGDSTVTTVEYEGYDKQNKGFSNYFTSAGYRGSLYDGVWDGNTISFQEVSYAPDGAATRARCKFSYSENFTKSDYACETLSNGEWWTSRQGSANKK